ncbi:MAG: DUF3592 domain-containing protein [Planctomycetota bacterium]
MSRSGQRSARNPTDRPPLGCLIAFCSIFVIAGLGMFSVLTVWPLLQKLDSRSWVEVPCTILSSRLEVLPGGDGSSSPTYRVRIEYEYEFEGSTLRGDRYDFTNAATSGRSGKQAVVERFPVGSRRSCFVDPGAPERSVVRRELGSSWLFGLIALPFLAIPITVVVAARRRTRLDEGPRSGRATAADADSGSTAAIPLAPDADGFVRLRRRGSPRGKAIGLTLFALLWNGILLFVLGRILEDGGASRVALVFLLPFGLAGLVIVFVALHAVLSLFSPRPTIILRRGGLAPGDALEFAWEFTGRVDRLESLRITWVGLEWARHQVGTETKTTEHRFHEETIISLDAGEERASGLGMVRVPPGSMPTFRSRNNEIRWFLELKGTIRRWPDLAEEFPVPIHPHPLEGEVEP